MARLNEEIEAYNDLSDKDELIIKKRTRNSLIHTYEFTIEIFWKLLHTLLRDQHGITFESISSYQTFRQAARIGIILTAEFQTLTELVADRNRTSHSYRELLAIEIADRIPAHYQVMKKILDRIKI